MIWCEHCQTCSQLSKQLESSGAAISPVAPHSLIPHGRSPTEAITTIRFPM